MAGRDGAGEGGGERAKDQSIQKVRNRMGHNRTYVFVLILLPLLFFSCLFIYLFTD